MDIDRLKVNPNNPDTIPKFVDELPKPPLAKSYRRLDGHSYYEMEMRAAYHSFHSYFPRTYIWGYNGLYPGPTFEVKKDETILVKWINNLPEKHFLPLDLTLHGAIDCPEVRSVVHLHGANVAPDSDGHPDAWFTRNYEYTGKTFSRKVYEYTNHQQGTMLWYHDHSLGTTRLNVYAGLAGLYLIRDTLEERLNLPKGRYELPLVIQDKSFNEDGSLFYPDAPPFPVSVKPSVIPAFVGDTIVVNGKVWPYLRVEPRKYRFRVLNASNTSAYNLSFENGMDFHQIGTDGGLMDQPVRLNSIPLEPAERIDLIVDFSELKGQKVILQNTFSQNPNTGTIMQFRVDLPLRAKDESQIPETLYPHAHLMEEMAAKSRNLTLSATADEYGRPMLLLNNKMWTDPTTENPEYDSIEVWNILNLTAFPHPVHVHLVQFLILDRRPFDVQEYETTGKLVYTGPAVPPAEYERGWKDVIKTEPGMSNRIIMHFKDHEGDYVWHCHILEHEDHDMMRPMRVVKGGSCKVQKKLILPHKIKNLDV
jgi:spore coat protein A